MGEAHFDVATELEAEITASAEITLCSRCGQHSISGWVEQVNALLGIVVIPVQDIEGDIMGAVVVHIQGQLKGIAAVAKGGAASPTIVGLGG